MISRRPEASDWRLISQRCSAYSVCLGHVAPGTPQHVCVHHTYRACAPCIYGTVRSNLTQKSYKRTLVHCFFHKNEWTAPHPNHGQPKGLLNILLLIICYKWIFLYFGMALTVAEFTDGELLKTGLISNNLLPFIFVPALDTCKFAKWTVCSTACSCFVLQRPLCHLHRLSVSCASTSSYYCSCIVMHACVLILLQRPLMCHLHRLAVSCASTSSNYCSRIVMHACFDSSTAPTHVPPSPIVGELH